MGEINLHQEMSLDYTDCLGLLTQSRNLHFDRQKMPHCVSRCLHSGG